MTRDFEEILRAVPWECLHPDRCPSTSANCGWPHIPDYPAMARAVAEAWERNVLDYVKTIDRKNAALARPCLRCGYEHKTIHPASLPESSPDVAAT